MTAARPATRIVAEALAPPADLAPWLAGQVQAAAPTGGLVAPGLAALPRVAKRAFDVLLAAALLLLLAPLLAAVALAIRLDSPGPALLVQRRVGRHGRVFPMLKFRSMRLDAEAGGPAFAVTDDPRCTRLGRLLRRSNVDELPQLVNVLAGHMSLVGPRPERPEFVAVFRRSVPRYDERHAVRPGLTGWAQVLGLRGDPATVPARVERDLEYIAGWSLARDARILARTAVLLLRPARGGAQPR